MQVDLAKIVSSTRLAFDKTCSIRGWQMASAATKEVIDTVLRETGLWPTVFSYVQRQCAVMLVWQAHSQLLAINVSLDGSVAWTLSSEYAFAYQEIDGEGLGADFRRTLDRLKRHHRDTIC